MRFKGARAAKIIAKPACALCLCYSIFVLCKLSAGNHLWSAGVDLFWGTHKLLERSNDLIACWVLSTKSNEDLQKAAAIRMSWGRECNVLEFIDRDTAGVNSDWVEGYMKISGKSFRAWQLMHEKYVRSVGDGLKRPVDFVLKADTDSYIIGENMRTYLRRFDPDLPHYIGKQLVERKITEQVTPFVAGAAIILSRAALTMFSTASANNFRSCSHTVFTSLFAEDVAMGRCLNDLGIFPQATRDENGAERFMVFNPKRMSVVTPLPDWYVNMSYNTLSGDSCCSPGAISFHHVTIEEMLHMKPAYTDGRWAWKNLTRQGDR